MPLHVDRSALPLLQLRYVGTYSNAELVEFLRALDAVLELPGRKAGLIDLSAAKAGPALQRQMQGSWIRKNEQVLARDFAAAAIVTDSAIIRGTITAVFWIRPLPFPTRVSATVELAQAWLAPYLATLAHG